MSAAPDEDVRRILEESRTIAVVGCSSSWPKPSFIVPAYMQSEGYRIIPINQRVAEILGEPSLGSLEELDEPVDIVNVFRPAVETPPIARTAAALGAKCLWLQTGIVSEEARGIAEEGRLAFVEDLCIGAMHGDLGFGPGAKTWKAAEALRREAAA